MRIAAIVFACCLAVALAAPPSWPQQQQAQPPCRLDEDHHVCPETESLAPTEVCCEPALYVEDEHMNNCGGTRPTGLPFAGRSPVLAQNGIAATSQALSTMWYVQFGCCEIHPHFRSPCSVGI